MYYMFYRDLEALCRTAYVYLQKVAKERDYLFDVRERGEGGGRRRREGGGEREEGREREEKERGSNSERIERVFPFVFISRPSWKPLKRGTSTKTNRSGQHRLVYISIVMTFVLPQSRPVSNSVTPIVSPQVQPELIELKKQARALHEDM